MASAPPADAPRVRTIDIHRVDTPADLDRFLEELRSWADDACPAWLTFDLETRSDRDNLEDWHESSRIVSASFTWRDDESWVLALSHPDAHDPAGWRSLAREAFEAVKGRRPWLVGHNVKFDARWVLSATGVDLSDLLAWDTMAGAFLMDENQPHGLKRRASEDLGVDPWDDVDLSDAERARWPELARYNALDTAHTHALCAWQRGRLRDTDLGRVMWDVQMPAIRALTRVEVRGMRLDLDEVRRREREAVDERDRLYAEFERQVPGELAVRFQERFGYGGERLFDVGPPTDAERLSLAPTSRFFQEYASQAWPVLECSKSCDCQGGSKRHPSPSWDASVLNRLAGKGFDDASILLGHRKVDKLLTTYLRSWPEDVDSGDRLHPTYKTTSVVTGRLSCARPNLQQVDKGLKTCFESEPGWRFVQADYSQIEVRLAAWLSGDERLQTAYREGRDVYVETAAAVYGKDAGDVSKQERQHTKPTVLGFLYGMLAPSFVRYARDVYGLEFTPEEAEHRRDAFFELYPGLLDYHERQRRTVRRHREVVTPFGRRRRLPEVDSPDQQRRWSAERQAINAPIQSAASDLMVMALSQIDREVPRERCRLVGTVHDSALLEVREDAEDDTLREVGRIMLSPDALLRFPVDMGVPLTVEFEVGERWGDPVRVFEVSGGTAMLEEEDFA